MKKLSSDNRRAEHQSTGALKAGLLRGYSVWLVLERPSIVTTPVSGVHAATQFYCP